MAEIFIQIIKTDQKVFEFSILKCSVFCEFDNRKIVVTEKDGEFTEIEFSTVQEINLTAERIPLDTLDVEGIRGRLNELTRLFDVLKSDIESMEQALVIAEKGMLT